MPDHPWRFIVEAAYSRDEHWRAKGLLSEVQPFPRKHYLKWITLKWGKHKCLRIEKSRQLMVTWLLAALWLWFVLKNRGVRVAWICKKKEAAEKHLKDRLLFIYQHIPAHFEIPVVEFKSGMLLVYHDGADKPPTSWIEAIAAETGSAAKEEGASAAKQLRSFTYTAVVWDEPAFDRNQADIHGAALPCIDAGGWFNACSSANGENLFYWWGHGALDGTSTTDQTAGSRANVRRGLDWWNHNGFQHLRVHYTADPAKDPATATGKAWFAAVRPRYLRRQWEREMEINFSVPSGLPVYYDSEKIAVAKLTYDPGYYLARMWDYGWTCNVCVFGQVIPNGDKWWFNILYEIYRRHVPLADMAKEVGAKTKLYFPGAEVWDFGDPAGRAHGLSGEKAIETVRAAMGATTLSVPTEINERLDVMQWMVSAGWVRVHEGGAPMTLKALVGGYSRDDYGVPVKDGVFDHPADAVGYGVANLFRLRAIRGGGQSVELSRLVEVPEALVGNGLARAAGKAARGLARVA